MTRYLLLILTICLFSCSKSIIPQMSFKNSPTPPLPDYSKLEAWAAHPDKADFADKTPPNSSPEAQADALADVFFIHPTTYTSPDSWNADIHDPKLNKTTEESAIMHQASVFNASARVFAPKYRQMTLGGFRVSSAQQKADEKKALALAYVDVKAAFEHYLEHNNEGRPIIIAGHSQGAFHGIELVREFFDGTDLQQQLVAAYLPGWAFSASTFKHIAVSQAPDQIGCVMGWNTFKKNYIPKAYETYYKGSVSTNPLSWRTDETLVEADAHQGLLMRNYEIIRPQKVQAQSHDGLLWINRPHPMWLSKRYHIGDINIFWVNIRENVALRVQTFTQGKEAGE